jgi:hypothetical protein
VQVGGDDGVDGFRVENHPCCHCIDEHFLDCHVGVFFPDHRGDRIPHDHTIPLRIALRNYDQMFSWPGARNVECEAHDALDAVACEYGDFGRDFPGLVDVGASALAGVLAFGVLAHDHPVEIGGPAVAEGGGGSAEDAGWADVGVLLEGLAEGEAEAPEGDVVGDVWGC